MLVEWHFLASFYGKSVSDHLGGSLKDLQQIIESKLWLKSFFSYSQTVI